jgi:phosphoenolpyruvate-protein kinase (PTS system EI component)
VLDTLVPCGTFDELPTILRDRFAAVLRESGSAVLAERVLDIRDVAALLVRALVPGATHDDRIHLTHDAVVVAQTLSPAQFIALDKSHLKAIVVAHGGATSHGATLAREYGVPAVLGARGADAIADGAELFVDGAAGRVYRIT